MSRSNLPKLGGLENPNVLGAHEDLGRGPELQLPSTCAGELGLDGSGRARHLELDLGARAKGDDLDHPHRYRAGLTAGNELDVLWPDVGEPTA